MFLKVCLISFKSQKHKLGVTKKDLGSNFHFHVVTLFKFQSKLGLTEHENEHKKFKKKIEKMKNLRTLSCYVIY